MTDEDEEFNRIEREAKQRMEAVSAALNKKAENARELGLDYEPAQQEPCEYCGGTKGHWEGCKAPIEPAQQEYERGFIDGMQEQMRRSVDRAVNAMAQRTWVELTDEERKLVRNSVGYSQFMSAGEYAEHVQKATEFKLLEKNT
jgi:hypothetical protein